MAASTKTVGVVGLGYVGQPFVVAMAGAGFDVIGLDVDVALIEHLRATYAPTVHEPGLAEGLAEHRERIVFTTSYEEMMAACDAVFVSVGTPLGQDGEPDVRSMDACIAGIAPRLRPGQLITLRSTVIPGTTRRAAADFAAGSGLRLGTEFFVAFSPERTVSGKALEELSRLPVIVGGIDDASAERCAEVMGKLAGSVVLAPSTEVAEVATLVDNMYRTLNIGFANELGRIAEEAGIDAYDVVSAVNTSYDRTSVFRPALGAEGPCLSKDPLILRYFAHKSGASTEILDAVVAVNARATGRVANEILGFLGRHAIEAPAVALLGLAFKGTPETDDVRGSPAVATIREVAAALGDGAVAFRLHDSVVHELNGVPTEPSIEAAVEGAHVIAVMNDHRAFRGIDARVLAASAARPLLIIDAWHSLDRLDELAAQGVDIIRVGDGRA
jgi:nucleotide sugar dehydrogenase